MKNIFLIVFSIFAFGTLFANEPCFPDDPECIGDDGTGGATGGGRTTPINDYAPILVITGAMIAGVYLQRKKQLFNK